MGRILLRARPKRHYPAVAGMLAGLLLTTGPLYGQEQVEFTSAQVQPSAFRQRLAREKGGTAQPDPGVPLKGYLTIPQSAGPFPAVVLLHGCAGLARNVLNDWSARLAGWGYATLAVDSFATRGIDNTCERRLYDRVYDAYGGLDFLGKDKRIDLDLVAVMGFSAGGIAALQAVQRGEFEAQSRFKFRAAVAWYPYCDRQFSDAAAPTLILIGELDDWSPARACREMMEKRTGNGAPIRLRTYPNAHHAFDNPQLAGGVSSHGHFLKYDATAAEQAAEETRQFLAEVLRE